MLDVKNLTIRFGGLVAVDKVNVSLEQGETLGVIGPNGSGKTTFFNLLSGIYRPTGGSILLDGQSIEGRSADQVFRLGIARTFQNGRLFWNLNVIENVLMGFEEVRSISVKEMLFGRSGHRQVTEKATEIMSVFGDMLIKQSNKLSKDLPYADRRRLEICRALASHPKILLLDEPSAGMDATETATLMHDLNKVKAKMPELSIIVVEHDMDFIKGLVDKVMVLNYGRCIACGTFDEVEKDPEVIKAYLGQEESAC